MKNRNFLVAILIIVGILFSFSAYGEFDKATENLISIASQDSPSVETFQRLLPLVAQENFSQNSSEIWVDSFPEVMQGEVSHEKANEDNSNGNDFWALLNRGKNYITDRLKNIGEVLNNAYDYAFDKLIHRDDSYITIVVNETIMPGINASLEQYVADLKNESYIPTVVDDKNFKTPEQLKEYLRQEYEKGRLNGVFLVGDLPVARYSYFSVPPSAYNLSELFTARDAIDELMDNYKGNYTKDLEERQRLRNIFYQATMEGIPEEYRMSKEEIKLENELDNKTVPIDEVKFVFIKTLTENMQNGNVTRFLRGDENNTFGSLFPKIYSKEEIDKYAENLPSEGYPIDLYYTDLGEEWESLDKNGILYVHNAGKEDQTPEIYSGRLVASPFTKDEDSEYNSTEEVEILNEYFARNHNFRTGELKRSNRALVFVDDGFRSSQGKEDKKTGLLYNLNIIDEFNETNSQNYLKQLQTEDYDWVSLFAHSSSEEHQFGHYATQGVLFNYDLNKTKPYFYNLFSCSAADYSKDNYIAGQYIFGENNSGLAVIGSTKIGGMISSESFYESLEKSNSLGEAFKDWQISRGPTYDLCNQIFDYGMTILGDPTLVPHPE